MTHSATPTVPAPIPDRAMIWIPGATFAMGSESFYPEERPVRKVAVDGFWIDTVPVTNTMFGQFVDATGYITVAERPLDPDDYPGAPPENLAPGSMVFVPTSGPVDQRHFSQWWRWVPGASWHQPLGPGSTVEKLGDHPLVHVADEDVRAYCTWAGTTLPSEAEWEYAARGGLDGAIFTWGNDDPQDSSPLANTWQGRFPWENRKTDGWVRTSPVASFPANGYGLFDMAGNVWEWTADWYSDRPGDQAAPSCCVARNPRGGRPEHSYDPSQPHLRIPRKVVKGGSHLCSPTYCYRYRPAARQAQMIDTGMSHLGFRCIVRPNTIQALDDGA
jgi:sulfatase modifying factor 1